MRLIVKNRYRIIVFILIIFIMSFAMMGKAESGFTLKAEPAKLNSDTQINLSWPSITDASHYSLYRDDTLVANIDVDTQEFYLNFEDTGLVPNTDYEYKVIALMPNGSTIESELCSAKTATMRTPSIVSSHLDINNKEVTLSWVNNSLSAKTIIIKKIGIAEPIVTVSSKDSSVSFHDPSLSEGVPSSYVILSMDEQGATSPESTPAVLTPIELPRINASIDGRIVTITWDKLLDAEHFLLERAKYSSNSWGVWEAIKTTLPRDKNQVTDNIGSGTYRYRLYMENEEYRATSNISKPVTRLLAPSDLKCIPTVLGRIDLSWTNPPGKDFIINVERRDNPGEDFKIIASLDSNINSYFDAFSIEPNKSYYYKITARDGSSMAATPIYHISTGPPSPAKSLTLEILSPTKIGLNWQDSSNNESGFKVERKTDSGGFMEIALLPPNTTQYIDNVGDLSEYTYRVIPFNLAGDAPSYSNTVKAKTSLNKLPPRSLEVNAVANTQIDLSWEYDDLSNRSTVIERKMGEGGNWNIVKILGAGITNYSDIDLLPSTQFFYRVRTLLSDNVYSIPYPDNPEGTGVFTKIETPSNLKAIRQNSGAIKLTWTDMLQDETEFIIERSAKNGPFIKIATQKPGSNTWYDFDALDDIDYTYRIKAINPYNSSIYSNTYFVERLPQNPPENLSMDIISRNTAVLHWEIQNSNISKFMIDIRSKTSEPWKRIATLPAGIKSLVINNLEANTLYHVQVLAVSNSPSQEPYTSKNEFQFVMEHLEAPTNLVAKTLSPTQVILEWENISQKGMGIIIERSVNGGDFLEITRVGKDISRYLDNTVSAGNLCKYRLKSFSTNTFTDYSNTGVVRTLLPETFADLSFVPWAKNAIENLAALGVVQGKEYNAGKQPMFAPNDKITRAEFITLVIKAFSLDRTPVGTFSDVKPNHWYYKNVIIAKNMGIVTGMGDDYFYPNNPIKREDMAVILAKTYKILEIPLPHYNDSILDKYKDKGDISPYALASIASLNGEKIINGKSSHELAPQDYSTRAEAAVMIYNILKR